MVREIARTWPQAELMATWTWFQSGLSTDGAHNPVTSRSIEKGDILSLNCFPVVAGYYVALERTLFPETATDEHIGLWEINCAVHDRGKESCPATGVPKSPGSLGRKAARGKAPARTGPTRALRPTPPCPLPAKPT
jgi:hypothetical protein